VIASEVLRDKPRAALTALFGHLGVAPAAVDLDERYRDNCSTGKPVPRLHDLEWLPRRPFKPQARWRPDQRTGLARLLTTRRARAGDSAIPPELRDRLTERIVPDLRRFEHLLGHQVPSHWGWSASVSARDRPAATREADASKISLPHYYEGARPGRCVTGTSERVTGVRKS
jgi:hypothetical protein